MADTTIMRSIPGKAASDGISIGTVLWDTPRAAATEMTQVDPGRPLTRDDVLGAMAATAAQLKDFQKRIVARIEEPVSDLFCAHLAILADHALMACIDERLGTGLQVVEAVRQAFDHFIQILSTSRSLSVREKSHDLRDLCQRVLANLGGPQSPCRDLSVRILIAEELLPSDLLRVVAEGIGGIILTGGGVTAHIAMLARSLQVPMVLSEGEAVSALDEGQRILLDAIQGTVVVDPDEALIGTYAPLLSRTSKPVAPGPLGHAETMTRDGRRIRVFANVGLLAELPLVHACQAEGIGLYRSEIPFLVRDDLPSEVEQMRIYRRLLEGMGGRPVVFRTLDVGGDKVLSYYPQDDQANPSLGLRGIRFSLRHQAIFRTQLRALLRSGHGHRLQILFPLVSSVDAFLIITGIVRECIAALIAEGLDCNRQPELGVMIELPSAVGVVEELAGECDFLSIGTNDLVQHILVS